MTLYYLSVSSLFTVKSLQINQKKLQTGKEVKKIYKCFCKDVKKSLFSSANK